MEALETGNDQLIAILNKGGNGENNQILTIINTEDDGMNTVLLPEGKWDVYVDVSQAGTEVIKTVSGSVNVPCCSVMILVQEGEPDPTFSDVPAGAYCFDAVEWAVEKGITAGTGDGLFLPLRQVTRAEVVTMLWSAAGKPVVESDKSFSDVPESAFFHDAVIWAAEKGITAGKGDGKFDPAGICSRAEIMTFLWVAAGKPSRANDVVFSDVKDNQFYTEAVLWAADKGITAGMGDGSFGIAVPCNRAHIVTFLYVAYPYLSE
jgi:hypothetical protein